MLFTATHQHGSWNCREHIDTCLKLGEDFLAGIQHRTKYYFDSYLNSESGITRYHLLCNIAHIPASLIIIAFRTIAVGHKWYC
jgi:hypothetical protein